MAIVTGSAAAIFLHALDWATEQRWEHGWLLWLLPLAGLASALLYRRFGQSVEGGNALLLQELHEPRSGVPMRMAPLIFLATIGAHLFGASVGREGTAV